MIPSSFKVMGAGSAILDLLADVDDDFLAGLGGEKGGMVLFPASGEADKLIAKLDSPVRAIGGSAANTIFALQNLKVNTTLLSKLGCDEEGKFYQSEYEEIGGDPSRFKFSKTLRTGRCVSMITPDTERTMRTDLGASGSFDVREISSADFAGIGHVHVEGYLMFHKDIFLHILKLAKDSGATVSLDLASFEVVRLFRDGLEDILDQYVDVVFANEDEARELTGKEKFTPEYALKLLHEYCPVSVVKLGKKGAVILASDEIVRIPAELVSAIDTTGAGDLWQAGFLYGYLNGYSMEISGKMGAHLASEVVQIIGASIPRCRWVEIRSNFKKLAKE